MWPFKPKSAPQSTRPKLIYKSGEAFFRSQCQYGFTDIVEGQGIVAIVLDAREEFGTEVAVKVQPDGCQLATIRVASPGGGFRSFAETASPNGDRLKPGDLVVWVPMTHMQELANTASDHRQGWIGLIVAKVAPEADPTNNELSILCRY